MKTASLLLSAIAVLTPATAAFAQVTNPSFASDLTGWTSVGDVALRTYTNASAQSDSGAFLTSANSTLGDDGSSAFNFSGTNVAGIIDLETFAGLSAGALDLGFPDFAEEGSMLKQTVTVLAGNTLSFDWRYFSNSNSELDYAFVVVDGVVFDLTSGVTLSSGSTFSYGFNTPLTRFESSPFATDTIFDLVFGVVDVGSTITSSALLVDAVAIPEPSAFAALAGLGALGLAASRRRRRA